MNAERSPQELERRGLTIIQRVISRECKQWGRLKKEPLPTVQKSSPILSLVRRQNIGPRNRALTWR
jgi:hypothetical protein